MQAMSIEPGHAQQAPTQASQQQQQQQQKNAPTQQREQKDAQETAHDGCEPDDVTDEARFILEHVRISGHDPMEPRPEGPVMPYIL